MTGGVRYGNAAGLSRLTLKVNTMKKILIGLTALALVVVAATAAQKTATVRDIERPRLLADILDNNFDELYAADAAMAAGAALGATALQPNAASYTNVIISADDKTNTIIVIKGQVTSWVITE